MLGTFLGIILLAIPFFLLTLFDDKKKGFVYILFLLLVFHTLAAVITQTFGIFYYWPIFLISLFMDLAIILFWFYKRKKDGRIFGSLKFDWVLVAVIAIAFLALYQVHYNYTGKINLATDKTVSYHEVKNMRYVYPYFSDEWYAVLLIENSINSHSLPFKAFGNDFFLNLEMFFHSLLAELILLLGINPLTQYALLSVFFNTLIIVLAYVFLRLSKIPNLASAIASLSLLYIASGANLPGFWQLIPVHLGLIFLLIGLCYMAMDKALFAVFASLPIIFFYGPLFFFYGAGLAAYLITKFFKQKKETFKAAGYFLIFLFLIIPISYVVLMVLPFGRFFEYINSKLFYTAFTGYNMPQLNFYYIIPIWAVLLCFLGLPFVIKNKKWIFFPFVLGVFYWIFCSSSIYRILIEYERTVFFTSIATVLISGFGLHELEKYFNKCRPAVLKYLEAGAVVLFLIMILFYTQLNNWEKLVLKDPRTQIKSYPKAPANNYLTEDDLRLFGNLKGKRFLSLPWKGTVLGVATKNHPVLIKDGTISMGEPNLADQFINSDCGTKSEIAKRLKLDYVYISQFECKGFEELAQSREELVLYKVN